MKILIINGPNLNLLGRREESIYGKKDFETYLSELKNRYTEDDITYYQSNHEGEIIDMLHNVGFGEVDAIVLNAGAYTHTSIAISDAILFRITTSVLNILLLLFSSFIIQTKSL